VGHGEIEADRQLRRGVKCVTCGQLSRLQGEKARKIYPVSSQKQSPTAPTGGIGTLPDAPDEVVERGSEEAFGDLVVGPRGTEAVDGGRDVRQFERRLRQDCTKQANAGKRGRPAPLKP
jgi:hypothetical protein